MREVDVSICAVLCGGCEGLHGEINIKENNVDYELYFYSFQFSYLFIHFSLCFLFIFRKTKME